MKKVLTISVAAYNVEDYLDEALDSCVISEFMDELEVIVVNDGSKDNSVDIARKYTQLYPNTFKLIDKDNGGYGTTVNASLSVATGDFFRLLDGDDWFVKDGLVQVISTLKKCKSDVVVLPYYKGETLDKLEKTEYAECHSQKQCKVSDLRNKYLLPNTAIIYRTSVIKESGLQLPSHMLYTDQLYCTIPFSAAETVEFYNIPLYCYRLNRDEQSVSKKSRMKNVDMAIEICYMLCDYAKSMENNKNYSYIMHRVAAYYAAAIRTLLLFPVSKKTLNQIKECETRVANISSDVYKDVCTVGKVGILLLIWRKTGYITYWIMKLFAGKIQSWA